MIKFRGKHNDKWVYGYFRKSCDGNCFISYEVDKVWHEVEVYPETVGQCIPIINGIESYENDILYSPYRNYIFILRLGKARYIGCGVLIYGAIAEYIKPKSRASEPFLFADGRNDWKVIGNIYENKELLND